MKKKMLRIAGLLLAGVMLAGCGSSSKYDTAMSTSEEAWEDNSYLDYDSYDSVAEYETAEEAAEAPSSANGSSAEKVNESAATTNRKLIRTVSISVETYDFDSLTSKIANKVAALGGYIESSNVDGESKSQYSTRSASYTLRIPKENADEFIEKVEGESNVTHHSENQQDVTLDYVDSKSKKEALQVEYDRLEELLKNADTVEELIYIEERLADVRYQIQSIESQLRTYDNKVDYTTISLYVEEVKEYTEPVQTVEEMTLGQRIVNGFSKSISAVWTFLQDFVVFIVVSIPFLVLIAIPVVIVILIVKAWKKKSAKKKAEYEAKVASGEIKPTPAKSGFSYTDMMNKQANTEEVKVTEVKAEDTKNE